ncbi:MAG: hypothetical protein H0U92_12540 [Actinobacteria bacterium]|nr:hypothetical protein [Actinomycetota bacterium]
MVVRKTAMVVAVLTLGLGACGGGNQSGNPVVKAKANAVPIAAVKPSSSKAVDTQLAERVFDFGDLFAALDYKLSFTGDARNAADIARLCGTIASSHDRLRQDLTAVTGKPADVAALLVGSAASAATACSQNPVTDAAAEAVHLDFGAFRELAFDFAGLLSPSA